MLCATLGVKPDFDQSGAYIKGWLEALQNDSRLIFKAVSAAQKAVDFITAAATKDMAVAA
jgi:antirestriction protein ArdC